MTATIDTPSDEGAAAAGRARVAELLATPPETIDGVIAHQERLQEILESEYGPGDGVASFNRLYLRITRGIRDQLDDDLFADRDFLVRLDVEFARRYFRALHAEATGGTPPRSWGVLLERRRHERISPVEYAVVGVNAHVNFDLAPAVVRTCTVLGRSAPGPAERADYRAVNDVFSLHMVRLLDDFDQTAPGEISLTEQLLGCVADVPVVLARDVAWRQALELWELRSRPMEYENEVAALDRRTALLGRGLLTLGALT
ncbi:MULTISPECIES: DUF5995 family protein [unclassified Pseudonocardia]|uniref:DUF5995 family protein n=1 Tax=unclassified Pseudonocardia TaxID=2619320 RepID=UPI0009663CAA|nr:MULTISPECIES: DUF5995 family protein [unclassified Pseudonocardia]OLM31145.1 hypothetical protein Ae717Ps2_2040 [Pseudonocardia sp. Ae717_Ps2]